MENERKEIGKLLKRLQKEHGFSSKECLVVLEHTGLYIHNLVETAVQKKMPIWVEHSSRILMSSGLTRGKNDAIDAQRIAEYGYRFQEKAKLWKPVREVIQRLKYLNTQRDRLVKSRTVLQVPVAELVYAS